MNDIHKAITLESVRACLADDPGMFKEIIDAATQGVREFADSQSEHGTRASFILFCVLETVDPPKDGRFGSFSAEEALQQLEGCFGKTPALAKLKEKFLKQPDTH